MFSRNLTNNIPRIPKYMSNGRIKFKLSAFSFYFANCNMEKLSNRAHDSTRKAGRPRCSRNWFVALASVAKWCVAFSNLFRRRYSLAQLASFGHDSLGSARGTDRSSNRDREQRRRTRSRPSFNWKLRKTGIYVTKGPAASGLIN